MLNSYFVNSHLGLCKMRKWMYSPEKLVWGPAPLSGYGFALKKKKREKGEVIDHDPIQNVNNGNQEQTPLLAPGSSLDLLLR